MPFFSKRFLFLKICFLLIFFSFIFPFMVLVVTFPFNGKTINALSKKILYATLIEKLIDKKTPLQTIRNISELINFNIYASDLIDRNRHMTWKLNLIGGGNDRFLLSGYGLCGHLDALLITFVNQIGLKGRIVDITSTLPGDGHQVAEIYLNGKWVMIDPYYALIYVNKQTGKLCSVAEIAKLVDQGKASLLENVYYLDEEKEIYNEIPPLHSTVLRRYFNHPRYGKIFNFKTIYSVAENQKARRLDRIKQWIVEMIYSTFGSLFFWNQKFLPGYRSLFFSFYLTQFDKNKHIDQYKIAKYWYFLGKYKKAEVLFRKMIQKNNQEEPYYYDARLWSIMNQYKMGFKKEADRNLETLIADVVLLRSTFKEEDLMSSDEKNPYGFKEKDLPLLKNLFEMKARCMKAYLDAPNIEDRYRKIMAENIAFKRYLW